MQIHYGSFSPIRNYIVLLWIPYMYKNLDGVLYIYYIVKNLMINKLFFRQNNIY